MEWAPIEDQNGRIQHLLVAIKDVTELRTIQEEARKKQAELQIIGQILKHSGTKFERFIQSCFNLIEDIMRVLKPELAQKNWDVVLRDLHTIR